MAPFSFECRQKGIGGADAELELGGPRAGHLTTADAELELGGPRAGHLTTEEPELELGGPRGSENNQQLLN